MFRDAFVEFRHGSGYRAEETCRYEPMITSFEVTMIETYKTFEFRTFHKILLCKYHNASCIIISMNVKVSQREVFIGLF